MLAVIAVAALGAVAFLLGRIGRRSHPGGVGPVVGESAQGAVGAGAATGTAEKTPSFCLGCGASLNAEAKFCAGCGKQV